MGPPQPPQPPLRRHHKHKHFHTRSLCGHHHVSLLRRELAHSNALHTPAAPHRGSCLTPTTLTRWDGHRNAHRYTRGRERCVPSQVWCSTGARASPARHPGARRPPPPRNGALRTLPRPDTRPPLSLRTQGATRGRPPNLRQVPTLILRENKGERQTGNSARTCVAR